MAGKRTLVHNFHSRELLGSGKGAQGCRFVLALEVEGRRQILIENIVDQGRLARAGDPCHAGEDPERDVGIQLEEIVTGRTPDPEVTGGGATVGRNGD